MTFATLDRFRGCMLGTALGDATGASWEGRQSAPSVTDIQTNIEKKAQLRYTDDTAMTIGVAESLAACKGFDGQHMAQQFRKNYYREPWRGYGPGPPLVFNRIAKGEPWQTAAEDLYPGGSYGNGAAMRAAPMGLFYHNVALEELRRKAYVMATITHHHPLGKEGAALQAYIIALVCQRDPRQPLDISQILNKLLLFTRESIYQQKLRFIPTLLGDLDSREIVKKIGHGVAAQNSVVTAILCFLAHPTNSIKAILHAISLGGDTDTIASMTGAISGAFLGTAKLSKEWLAKLERAEQICNLATELYYTCEPCHA